MIVDFSDVENYIPHKYCDLVLHGALAGKPCLKCLKYQYLHWAMKVEKDRDSLFARKNDVPGQVEGHGSGTGKSPVEVGASDNMGSIKTSPQNLPVHL